MIWAAFNRYRSIVEYDTQTSKPAVLETNQIQAVTGDLSMKKVDVCFIVLHPSWEDMLHSLTASGPLGLPQATTKSCPFW